LCMQTVAAGCAVISGEIRLYREVIK
jgi:hypothetical protein